MHKVISCIKINSIDQIFGYKTKIIKQMEENTERAN